MLVPRSRRVVSLVSTLGVVLGLLVPVLLDVPAATREVAEGEVPDGAAQADNSAGDAGWTGPCPPSGTHHYRFTVYGLSKGTGLDDGASLEDALAAVGDAAVAEGTLVGTYRRR